MSGLSIIVSWCDREEIGRSIDSLRRAAEVLGGELIVVNMNGDPARLSGLIGDDGPETVHRVTSGKYFNKCLAQNVGASIAAHDTLFFCDCDIVVDAGTLAELLRKVSAQDDSFGTIAGVIETEVNSRSAGFLTKFGYTLHLKTGNGRTLTIIDHEEDADDGSRQAPGLLMVRQKHFRSIDGYNSGFGGWGWEDQDIIARLTLGLGLERIQHGVLPHISHDDHARTARFEPSTSDRWESRDRIFRKALANYDRAHFDGTFSEDVAGIAA